MEAFKYTPEETTNTEKDTFISIYQTALQLSDIELIEFVSILSLYLSQPHQETLNHLSQLIDLINTIQTLHNQNNTAEIQKISQTFTLYEEDLKLNLGIALMRTFNLIFNDELPLEKIETTQPPKKLLQDLSYSTKRQIAKTIREIYSKKPTVYREISVQNP